MSPAYFHQAGIWLQLLKEFGWKSANLIHSSDNEGKMVASKFHYLADHYDIKVFKRNYLIFSIFFFQIKRY